MNSSQLPKDILKISHLRDLPQANTAQDLLFRAAKAVSPLLQRRKWTIHHLTEFYPSSPELQGLNINYGSVIKIRLRNPQQQNDFLCLDYIIGTLIHEITHISIGPHSAEFFKLMEELTTEVEKDLLSGVDSQGNLKFAAFTGVARKLGSSNSCGQSIPFDKKRLHSLQVQAAVRREQNAIRSKGSGQVLGGSSTLTTRENPSGIPSSSRLLMEFSNLSNNSTSLSWNCPVCTFENCSTSLMCEVCNATPQDDLSFESHLLPSHPLPPPPPPTPPSSSLPSWICPFCTFENVPIDQRCRLCGVIQTQQNSSGLSNSTSVPSQAESISEIILLDEDNISSQRPIPPPPATTTTKLPSSSNRLKASRQDSSLDSNYECMWICSRCTFANTLSDLSCAICLYTP